MLTGMCHSSMLHVFKTKLILLYVMALGIVDDIDGTRQNVFEWEYIIMLCVCMHCAMARFLCRHVQVCESERAGVSSRGCP